MSREERRAYRRMMKNQDPYALPARASTGAAAAMEKRRARRKPPSGEFSFVTGRFLAWTIGGAVLAGLVGFSIAWPSGMPMALYTGLAVAAGWVLVALGVRILQRRIAAVQR